MLRKHIAIRDFNVWPPQTPERRPITKLTTNKTRNTTNRIQAICVAAPAIPVSPRTPAINPIIRKVIAQLSMALSSFACYAALKTQYSTVLVLNLSGALPIPLLHSREAKNPGDDQVNSHDIIQQSGHQQNKDSGNQGDQRLQGNVKLHR
jgi:hypothetical protein